MMTDQQELTLMQLVEHLDIKESSVRAALTDMNIRGYRPSRGDRRAIVYAPGTLERISQWVKEHSDK